jgi:ribosomal protein S18 acetylase RimI-like enzyme
MRAPADLVPRRSPDPAIAVHRVHRCHPQLWRNLYQGVGSAYRWTDRLGWTDDEIRRYLEDPATSLFVMTHAAAIAGYYELRAEADGSVEIAYFGLLSDWFGRGFGAHLLTDAVEQAWRQGATRVWLHTCSYDHPAALPNYLKAGFSVFRRQPLPPL